MFAGHLGVGLALKRVEPRLNVAALLLASLAPDLVLGLLVLLGVERVVVPPDYASRHYLGFVFPWSHSLVSGLAGTVLAFAIGAAAWRGAREARLRVALAVALAFGLHWVGDWIEHPQLPVIAGGSRMLGLGLWERLPLAVGLEVALAAVGLTLCLSATRGWPGPERWALASLVATLTATAAFGQAMATQAPPATALAVSWIAQTAVIVGAAAWLDRPASPGDV